MISPSTKAQKQKPTLGRPVRHQEAESGRNRLVDATRELVRSNPSSAHIRGEVARVAGVTPALVCYYFPNHTELLECAVKTTIEQYLRDMLAILAMPVEADEKLRCIIGLLLRVNREETNFVDFYIDLLKSKKDGEAQTSELITGYKALTDFVADAKFSRFPKPADPRFFVLSLWGTCRIVAQAPRLPIAISGERADESKLVDLVASTFGHRSLPPSSPEGAARI